MKRLIVFLSFVLIVLNGISAEHVLTPDGQVLSSFTIIDSPQPDTIFYDNGTPGLLTTATNYWNATRFTAPSEFELRSVYFAVLNQGSSGGTNSTAPCSVFVYTDTIVNNVNYPGSPIPQMWIRINPPLPNLQWIDRDFPDSVTIAAGQSFWIVYGPAPGGAYSGNGWWNIMDGNGNTANRSRIKTGSRIGWTTGTSIAGGDLILRAGGELSPFTDIRVDSIYSASAGVRRFYYNYNQNVNFSATVRNSGTGNIQSYQVHFALIDTTTGDTVFQQVMNSTSPLLENQSATFTTTSVWNTGNSPFNGILHARAIVNGDNVPDNNIKYLEQKVSYLNSWFRYEDGTSDALVNFGDNNKIGVLFIPTRYPAKIDTVAIRLTGTTTPRADTIGIYLSDISSAQTTPAFIGTVNVVGTADSLYRLAVNPPVNIFNGGAIVAFHSVNGHSLARDNNQPLAGTNLSMPPVTWQSNAQGVLEADESGDWIIRAYISPSNALPPYPVLRTIPPARDTVFFDTIEVGQSNSKILRVFNDGGQPLIVSRIFVSSLLRTIVTFSDTAFTVAGGDSFDVTITWTPPAPGTLNSQFTLQCNAEQQPVTYRIRGYARPTYVRESETQIPSKFTLAQNHPNPFNPTTDISFTIPMKSHVKLAVFDVMGREVMQLVNENLETGVYTVTLDATQLPAGVYFYKMTAGNFNAMKKMILLK
ncbi:MAG: T9SS type A sorting domain-containing protein [bacterium]|nr:T9SS type A sorting domain-containing protein [bacterium]